MELTANALQLVAASQNVLFTETAVPGSCSIIHREGSGLTTLRGLTHQCKARFRISFGGNISVPTGGTAQAISLALAIDGEPVGSTTMTVTPAAVDNQFNVFSSIFLNVPAGCCVTIAVKNISTVDINVQNANLIVERVA